ncbi:MAG: hypothetical protein H0W76_12805 [Pyrinomonadaceae bacterium]|nr:hypothetical protein [Pyrinomonadaceae bacterium]
MRTIRERFSVQEVVACLRRRRHTQRRLARRSRQRYDGFVDVGYSKH